LSNKDSVKHIESVVEAVLKKHLGDLGHISASKKQKIYEDALGGMRLDKKIYTHNGRGEEPDFRDASPRNIKKVKQKRNKFFFYMDMPNNEYLAGGKRLCLAPKEADLLIYFLKNSPPSQSTILEIYRNVWPYRTIKPNHKKSVEECLARLRKKIERATKQNGTDVIKYWVSHKRRQSVFGVNPILKYCMIFD